MPHGKLYTLKRASFACLAFTGQDGQRLIGSTMAGHIG